MKITKASMTRFSVVSSPKPSAPKSTSQSSAMGEACSPTLASLLSSASPAGLRWPEGWSPALTRQSSRYTEKNLG